jgi:signal transduction histidine kinase
LKSLYLRIWITVVAALALFALVAGWLFQRQLDDQRVRADAAQRERLAAWGDLIERSLPGAGASAAEQAQALNEWSQRLRMPMALDDSRGQRIARSNSFARRELEMPDFLRRVQPIPLDDGRTLWVPRPGAMRPPGAAIGGGPLPDGSWLPRRLPEGAGLAALLVVIFLAVAAGVWPVARRLTRRLVALKQGVEAFGAGALHQRVAEDGSDEVAAVGASFNRAAARIEALLRSHQSLLANASHELRSPLARLKMALAMLEEVPPPQRERLKRELDANIAELDALVEEVLLASRLDAADALDKQDRIPLLALAAEEAAHVQASAHGEDLHALGDERLLRRAVRNLLENARRYGGGQIEAEVVRAPGAASLVELRVSDRGPGVPEAYRERIFEAFFRLPGHAEREGGVGLGLALVRQIAQRHGGSVRCLAREGGGSSFVLSLPLSA